jgi:hypothetical protein
MPLVPVMGARGFFLCLVPAGVPNIALTGPPIAALTDIPWRHPERELPWPATSTPPQSAAYQAKVAGACTRTGHDVCRVAPAHDATRFLCLGEACFFLWGARRYKAGVGSGSENWGWDSWPPRLS